METVDLSHSISQGMPVYPGTEPPIFTTACTYDEDGFIESKITLYSHTGTHLDAPAHIMQGEKTLDQFTVDHFVGKGSVLDLRSTQKQTIELEDLQPYQHLIKESEFILLLTGWSRFWNEEAYFRGYPILSPEAAQWLCSFTLKGLGVDMISVDEEGSTVFPIHRILLESDIVVIENLTNLESLPPSGFTFLCVPLKIERADGSPVRAVAMVEKSAE
ncbi:MAG: cyclase family protein [Deltaproteobacteria bacterium]|nr:cyclase family protein [Deltaproteobacteria bacterium]